jgi:hypothetical protein
MRCILRWVGGLTLIGTTVTEHVALRVLGVAAFAAIGTGSCATSTARPTGQSDVVRPGADTRAWIGRHMDEVIRGLGAPSQAYPLRETGGKILMFDPATGPHYVLEFGPDQRVVSAARVR